MVQHTVPFNLQGSLNLMGVAMVQYTVPFLMVGVLLGGSGVAYNYAVCVA